MDNGPSTQNSDSAKTAGAESPKRRKKSKYFGYACFRSLEWKRRLMTRELTVDELLDMTPSEESQCPHHEVPCECQKIEGAWIRKSPGRLALKLFLKHLEGETLLAFSEFVVANTDRFEDLNRVAQGHPNLLTKIKMFICFS